MRTDLPTSLLAAALKYAAKGWRVLPVQPNGKTPLGTLVPHGLLDATDDAGTLRRWWMAEPNANVAIRTGAISGLFVIDVDPRHGGSESLAALEHERGALPLTVRARTGGGGLHLLFAHLGGQAVLRNAVRLGGLAGLDLRGDGGYIVAPPSIHPSGVRYGWAPGCGPDDVALAPIPAWLLALLQYQPAALSRPQAEEMIVDGARNSTLASLAGTMRRRGMTTEAIAAALLAENERRCSPALPREEVESIAASIGRYDTGHDGSPPLTRRTRASDLVALADAELFHTPDGEAFATFTVGDHRETWPLRAKGFRRWLARRFYGQTGAVPGAQAIQDALGVLEGRALYDGPQHAVFLRVARHEDAVYFDLGNERWEAVRISPQGWEVVSAAPVRFRRSRGMAPLPRPVRGGKLGELRTFVNVATDRDWVLVAGWLVGAVNPVGPYPILALHGEQGSAKSTTARLLRALTDPNTSPLRAEPKDVRDLMIAATNGWVLALDNLSSLAPWLSDALCRLSSGGGFATRELHTDTDEVLFDAQRPMILNGIAEVASHSDLLDRVIALDLPPIPEAMRRTEAEVWSAFEKTRPRLLGALCDAVAAALHNRPAVRLSTLPRMADFAHWVTAAEPLLGWTAGTFVESYTGNRAEVHDLALDASPLAAELRGLLAECTAWTGTARDLLAVLSDRAGAAVVRQRTWPSGPRALSGTLRRLAPNLRSIGIAVEFNREPMGTRRRLITIRTEAGETVSTVPIVSTVPTTAHPVVAISHPDGRLDGGDGRDGESRRCSDGGTTDNGAGHDGRVPEPRTEREAFSPWPENIVGLGPHAPGSYSPCVQCGDGTWSRYGDRALCLSCARRATSEPRDPERRNG